MAKTIKQANIKTAIHYRYENVTIKRFLLSGLDQQERLAEGSSLEAFREKTGLADLYWQTIYYKLPQQERSLEQALAEADGYLFFMHGWDGSHRIWESLPLRLAGKQPNLVCFNLDVNGFGQSPFVHQTPLATQCSPTGLMRAVEYWLQSIGLGPGAAGERKRFYLFVGHSMSGAALFYRNIRLWQDQVCGFYALAPALFCNNVQGQTFFKTLGVSIRFPSFTAVKDALAPHLIEMLAAGASSVVKNEHLRIYNQTPFGTLAQTFYVLGDNPPLPEQSAWSGFRVALGHKDKIVELDHMLDLLEMFSFHPNQIRVTLGDHYFFSYGSSSPPSHKKNRQMLFEELLNWTEALAVEAKTASEAQ